MGHGGYFTFHPQRLHFMLCSMRRQDKYRARTGSSISDGVAHVAQPHSPQKRKGGASEASGKAFAQSARFVMRFLNLFTACFGNWMAPV